MMHLLPAVWLSFVAFAAHGAAHPIRNDTSGQFVSGTVYVHPRTGAVTFVQDVMDLYHGTAYGYFDNTLNSTGVAVLEIQTRLGNLTDNKQLMYAAGYLEGALTARQIWLNFINIRAYLISKNVPLGAFADFLEQQNTWMRSMIENHPSDEDAHWRHMSYVMAQYDGLYAGYKAMASPAWETDEFVVRALNSFPDHIELKVILSPQQQTDRSQMTPEQFEQQVETHGHCSAIVKVTPGFENIYMGHNTWLEYSLMNRIFKHYHLNVQDSATAAYSLSFSSYPGIIHSMDEYFQMSSGLVMLQTTNDITNDTLLNLITPQSLLCWQRVRVACMMANSGQEWYEAFRRYNSGTYNNQYMIVDLKKVRLGRGLDDGTLWVIEQMPGLVVGDDQTTILRAGYWPSYNIPFYPVIYNATGYQSYLHVTDEASYQVSPRAKIFRRDQGNIVDMKSMQEFMRYNDYQNDPYSGGDPSSAICSRSDLKHENPTPFGCFDAKVTDVAMARNLTTLMISGPTTSHNLPPFTWDSSFGEHSHVGNPTEYDFDWVLTKPYL